MAYTLLPIERAKGVPCIRYEDTRGCGYNVQRIQKIRHKGTKWVPILHPVADNRNRQDCHGCALHILSGAHYCSITCQLVNVQGGGGRAMAQELVESAETFGIPIHFPDRLCRRCLRVFWSGSCPDHMEHIHNQGHIDAGDGGPLISIEQILGWAAVDVLQVPANFVQDTQVIIADDGRQLCPIARLPPGVGGALIPVDPHAHQCARPTCMEVFVGPATFCSMRCRHHA
ncbi:hypothetical protein ACP4OV_029373 [Aristida adscensionis]